MTHRSASSNAHQNDTTAVPGGPAPGARWRKGLTVIGHRGAAGLVAENTLPSFRKAASLGVRAVELDVYVVDGELVVIHDSTVNRTTNGRGRVNSTSLEHLRSLDAGQSTAPGAQIPLLSEVFACLPSRVAVNIELKGPATAEPVARAIEQWQPNRPLLVSSFEHDQLFQFRALNRTTPVAPLWHRAKDFGNDTGVLLNLGQELRACAINLNARIASASRVCALREAGFGVGVYTVNSLRSAQRLVDYGVTAVFTDRPDRITVRELGGR